MSPPDDGVAITFPSAIPFLSTTVAPLSTLRRGCTARIVAIGDDGGSDSDLERRLLEIGFEEGKEVEILHTGPIGGDPLVIRVDRTAIAIRRGDARFILVEPGP